MQYEQFALKFILKMQTFNLDKKVPCHVIEQFESFHVNVLLKVNTMSVYTAIKHRSFLLWTTSGLHHENWNRQ